MWQVLVFIFWVYVALLVYALLLTIGGALNRHRRAVAVVILAPVVAGVVAWCVAAARADSSSAPSTTQVCDYRNDPKNPSCRSADVPAKASHDRLVGDDVCVLTGSKDGPDGCVILKQDVDHYEKATGDE